MAYSRKILQERVYSMKIKPFAVEEWMNAWETKAVYNIAETCVDSVSLQELFAVAEVDGAAFLNSFSQRRLTYGDIEGAPELLRGIASLYKTILPEEIVPTHGAAGANHHLFYSLVEPGDRVISVSPTYQQLLSIPEGYGANLCVLKLRAENGWLPDLSELRELSVPGTKLICINNPNNPTGALMDSDMLRKIVKIARSAGAYLLCDEVYRNLTQEDQESESIADLYEKGISVSSMSKVFSLAGLRLGWIATHDETLRKSLWSHRDYNHISCGMFDEAVAGFALAHKDAILARSRGIVRNNLGILDRFVTEERRISYVRPKAGTTALIRYDYSPDSTLFASRMLKETGAFVTPGDCFDEPKAIRVGYACDEKTLCGGLSAMGRFLRILEREEEQAL